VDALFRFPIAGSRAHDPASLHIPCLYTDAVTAKPRKPQPVPANQFLQMLHHLGWSLASISEPQPLPGGGHWQTAPLPDGRVLLIATLAEPLTPMEEAFKAYEDVTPQHRRLAAALAEAEVHARHALLLDADLGAQLIDLAQEEVLIEAHGREQITERLLPLLDLNALARGSLTAFPRKTLRQRSRELADWIKVWSARIGSAASAQREAMGIFFHWLLLARLAEQLGFGPRRKVRFGEYGIDAKPLNAVRYLTQYFKPLNEHWNLLQGQSFDRQRDLAQRAHDHGDLTACLQSFSRIGAGKFSAAVFAEAFADEELRLIGWRNSIVEGEQPSEEDPARWLFNPLTVDLDEIGFPMMLRRFDAITEDLRRLAREQAVQRENGQRPGVQLDVFSIEPPPITEEDTPRIVLQMVLRVRTARRERADAARLVLLAHAAEWHARLREAEPIFPVPNVTTTEPAPASPRPRPAAGNAGLN
jgi:hypothetical protein